MIQKISDFGLILVCVVVEQILDNKSWWYRFAFQAMLKEFYGGACVVESFVAIDCVIKLISDIIF